MWTFGYRRPLFTLSMASLRIIAPQTGTLTLYSINVAKAASWSFAQECSSGQCLKKRAEKRLREKDGRY